MKLSKSDRKNNAYAQSFLIDPNLGTANLSLIILFPGRDMTYERALEIIQTEEYLTAADIDLIHKRKKRSMTSSSKVHVF